MYCCTCKERAVSGHSEAGARNAEKDGGFTSRGEPEPGTGKVEGAGKEGRVWVSAWGDIVGGVVVGGEN